VQNCAIISSLKGIGFKSGNFGEDFHWAKKPQKRFLTAMAKPEGQSQLNLRGRLAGQEKDL
jgi:hypothetical protein